MKLNELRIGNYARNWLIEEGAITSIDSRTKEASVFHEKSGTHHCEISRIDPIPLTEEWLKRFGFEYDRDVKAWTILIPLDELDFAFVLDSDLDFFTYKHIKIDYVHQLQNLCFALTEEELEPVD